MQRSWQWLGSALEQQPVYYKGVNLWTCLGTSVALGETVELPDPQYPQQAGRRLSIRRCEINGETVLIAVGELTPSVYGFYVAV